MLAPLLCCADLFVYFYGSRFCNPAINQIFASQSKGWFPFILLCRRGKYQRTGPLDLRINYSNMISKLYQHIYSYTNIFFTEESKQTLRMILSYITSCEDYDLWKLQTVLSTCHNWELLIAWPHRPLCFKKTRTTTTSAFLISNIVVPYPYSHSTAFDPQSFTPLS